MGEVKKKHSTLILFSSLALILVPTLLFGLMGKIAEMGIALAAGALSACFLNLDKLQRFKGAGIELELREAVEEAYATIENLKVIAEPLIVSATKSVTWGNRWVGISEKDQHKIISNFREVTEKIPLSSDEVSQAFNEFYNINLRDKYYKLLEGVSKYYQEDVNEKLGLLFDYESCIFPSENQIRDVLVGLKINQNIEDMIQNYLFYKQYRNPKNHS